ncbi:phage major capsid protein [Parahaliea aestuarii]|uniref:Phage major capsid protein n=1 Tax=Parahaliea aestuarii TaxID=1852021 RepID=A0A5C8ZM97_9GAMM|nr:phage major capsid protein [Parahaliea aestuarii]TXS89578.1 phage major capsid protein [Parahaliea aestuarii]
MNLNEISSLVVKQGEAVQGFKDRYEGKLAELEEKFSHLDHDLTDLAQKQAAGRMAVPDGPANRGADIKGAFNAFLRKNDKDGLRQKSLSTTVEAEGGYTVIPYLDDVLIGTIAETNPILRDSARKVIDSNEYQQVFTVSGAASGRVAEGVARAETGVPTYARPAIKLTMQYAYPKATDELVLSSSFDMVGHVQSEIVTSFDADFEAEMLKGNGAAPNQKGILFAADSYDVDGVRSFASYQLVKSGADGDFGYDALVTLIHSLKPKYRKKAKLYASTSAIEIMRKFKDANGMPIWQDANGTTGKPQSIMGYVVEEVPEMPEVAAGSKSVMFGDLSKAYAFVSHSTGLQILRDQITEPGYTKFPSRMLCGSGPMDTRALKVMELAA